MSTLTVRKIEVDLAQGFGRHWNGGDAYRTQLFNALSMSFPLGEQMFIDAVRAVPQACLTDPLLREEVRDFIGQEATHRHVHAQYNKELERQGLPWTREAATRKRIGRIDRMGVPDRLAITCALEHYTAMLADGVLRHPQWLAGAEPRMHTVWSWHAVEETEHKGVAFDAYRAAGGGYWRRILWYVHVSFMFAFETFLQTCFNLRHDGHLFKARTWRSALKIWFGRNGLAGHLLRPGLDYLSPSFHPWRHDNRHLIESWLDRNSSAWRPVRPKTAGNALALPPAAASVIMGGSSKEKQVIRYMGTRKNSEGATVYVFIVNGLEKEVREGALKQHPGCYEALPASVKAKIAANRDWLSKL